MSKLSFKNNPYLSFFILALLLLTLPTLAQLNILKSSYVIVLGTTVIYTIAALGLNVLLGYSGLISLGTAGFMGLAAYMSAFITEKLAMPFELSFLVSVLLPTILGVLVGVMSLKFEGIYLAIATLAVSEILREIFIQFDWFTNGSSGAAAQYPTILGFLQLSRTQTYYLIVGIMLLVFIVIHNMMKGNLGRALNAMRGSEPAARAMGINVYKYRLIAFATATALSAIAGVLYVHFIRSSYPTTWSLNLSLDFLSIIVIGGFRSIMGTFLGAFFIHALSEIFLKPIALISNYTPLIKGILMIVFVIYYPQGLIGIKHTIRKAWDKLRKNKPEVSHG